MPEEELQGLLIKKTTYRHSWEQSYVISSLSKGIDFILSVLNITFSMQKTFTNVLSISVHPKYSQSRWMLSQWKEQNTVHYLNYLNDLLE